MFVYVLPDMTLMRMAIVCISAQMRMRICYEVILEGTADMSSFCYCYKTGGKLGASSNLALWPTSDFDP